MFRPKRGEREIAPDEIFLDSTNLPGRNDPQFEARVVRPLDRSAILKIGIAFLIVATVFAGRTFDLAMVDGKTYAEVSRNNHLDHSLLFANRGIVIDRTGKKLAWNVAQAPASSTQSLSPEETKNTELFALRGYTALRGLSLLLGFVGYPKEDAAGNWWREETFGVSGVELAFDDLLAGKNGSRMVEIDALGNKEEQSIVEPVENGGDVVLSIDAEVQNKLFSYLSQHAARQGFVGGAGVIMDVRTGELLALTSFPEYDNAAFAAGNASAVHSASNDPKTPLLNRAVSGLYAPGSIVKPIFAAAALNERIIDPEKKILSTGAITIPNPYDPKKPSVFRDWTVHGLVDMREAIAVSSDEYFYQIGGGYGSQTGLGVARLDEYARRFGLGEPTGVLLLGEEEGVIPTPEWKIKVFGPEDPWRIGDTYHTAIGQYGFQLTPLQAARFVAAIANGGRLLRPHIVASSTPVSQGVGVPDAYLQIVREGMRLAVTSDRHDATVKVLNLPGMKIAAKTGTAQIGANNEWINSWSIGFWPADNPRYAYAAVLERGPAHNISGTAPALRPFFEWLVAEKPQYLE